MSLQQHEDQQGTGNGQQEGEDEVRLQDSEKIRKEVKSAFKKMEDIDKRRDELNAEANEVRAKLKNKGIPTAAFNAAYSRHKMDGDKREAMDFAFALCCNAVGAGYQPELFENPEAPKTH